MDPNDPTVLDIYRTLNQEQQKAVMDEVEKAYVLSTLNSRQKTVLEYMVDCAKQGFKPIETHYKYSELPYVKHNKED